MYVFDCMYCFSYKSIFNLYIITAHTHKLICKPIKVMKLFMKIKLHITDLKSSNKVDDNSDDDNDNKLPVFLLLEGQFCWQGVLGQTHLDNESFQILK